MFTTLAALPEQTSYDVIVAGSGAAGLAAAVFAAIEGRSVLVIERTEHVGGTSALSAATTWIPNSLHAEKVATGDSFEKAARFLDGVVGNHSSARLREAFLRAGPQAIATLEERSEVHFRPYATHPDYESDVEGSTLRGRALEPMHGNAPGAGTGGRSLCAKPFDGRKLGTRLHDLRPPLEEIAPFGMNIASGADLQHFLHATRKLPSFLHVLRRLARHFIDRASHGRGLHLVNGNALVARLLKSADDLGIALLKQTAAVELLRDGERIAGAVVEREGQSRTIQAKRGVVLATGGFPHDLARKSALFPHAPTGREHWSAAPCANTGDGLRLGEAAGGHVRTDLPQAGAWAPVSLVPKPGGEPGRFPHLVERAKPGALMVRRDGKRFCNEADSYHDVMQALFAATPVGEPAEAWLICDHAFLRRYGLGRVRPRPFPIRPWLNNSYLRRGATTAELAAVCGIDAAGLTYTLDAYNASAVEGRDPEFGRGETPYNHIQGAADNQPNPCVAPLGPGPFYAVRIVPGSLGTFAGLKTDAQARVLDEHNAPIPGLYAVGNDMSSMMAGRYPAGGITLGPAMTFGYVAAHHAGGIPLTNNRS
jgi:succinate dehydrogenase/fumarate reductase flavoprotein subunit